MKQFLITFLCFFAVNLTAQEDFTRSLSIQLNSSILKKSENTVVATPSNIVNAKLISESTLGFDIEVSLAQKITKRYFITGKVAYGIYSYGYTLFLPKEEMVSSWNWSLNEKFSYYHIRHNRLAVGQRFVIFNSDQQRFFVEAALDIYLFRKSKSKTGYGIHFNNAAQAKELFVSDVALSRSSIVQLGWNTSLNYQTKITKKLHLLFNIHAFSTFNNIISGEYEIFTKYGSVEGETINKIAGVGITIGLAQDLK